MTEDEQRAAVIAAAQTWLGTPFRDNAHVKGSGVDCAQLLAASYEAAGVVPPQTIEQYSAQWFLHRDEERFLAYVTRAAHEIDISAARMGDIVVFKIGRVFAHGALVIEWPGAIIHAHKQSGCVLISRAFDGDLRGRAVRAFSPWGG